MPKSRLPHESPPLTAPVFHILLALADEERHGYGIMQDVAQQTKGALQLGPGTLYGCLKRMLASGLVEEAEERRDPALDDERRRYYRMTPSGKRAVRAGSAAAGWCGHGGDVAAGGGRSMNSILMSGFCRLYSMMLYAYPAEFRREMRGR